MKINKNIFKLLGLSLFIGNFSVYSSVANNIEIPNRYQTLEGEYITIENSIEDELHEIEIFGNTVQNENNLEDIQSVGDLYVDKNGRPILDANGREQYKIDIVSEDRNIAGKILNEFPETIIEHWGTYYVSCQDGMYKLKHDIASNNTQSSFSLLRPIRGQYGNELNTEEEPVLFKDVAYTFSFKYNLTGETTPPSLVFSYGETSSFSPTKKIELGEELFYTTTITPTEDVYGIGFYFPYAGQKIFDFCAYDFTIEESNIETEYGYSIQNKTTIILPTQLQKVGNVSDRLYWDSEKKRYVIEKNIGEFSSEWLLLQSNLGTTYHPGYAENYNNNEMKIGLTYTNQDMFKSFDILPVYNTLFLPINTFLESNGKKEGSYTRHSGMIRLWIDSERLKDLGVDFLELPANSEILSKQKLWLQNNPTIFYYISNNPEYIETNITSKLKVPTYKGRTSLYVKTENGISPNLKIMVDRLSQVAKNAIEEARVNPTTENISLARMYINMLSESINKDQLHKELNELFSSNITFDKKTATANLDVYIKSENMLLMNLSTNSITFDNYSGVDEIEYESAVEISINSSLPYQLNAYLIDEMYNNDRTKKINMDRLQIKDNEDTDYKEFSNINEKLVLKDSCNAGNNNSHSIDLKLKGENAYESDIYKTVMKFEVEQK